jgi:V8-like Glu-specific endopeptidase
MVHFRILVICSMIFSLFSCDSNESAKSKSCSSLGKIIIGDNDWIDYRDTSGKSQDANENTVAQIKIPRMMANCTGFLISNDVVMTNNHCINSASNATGVTAIFRNEDGIRETFSCSNMLMTNIQYDFTLIKCQGNPGKKYGHVTLAETRSEVGTPLYVVQENCDYLEDPRCAINKFVAFGSVQKSQDTRLYHDADTLGGSSGSPIFSDITHEVVALHNAGFIGDSPSQSFNLGVPMFQIKQIIRGQGTIQLPIQSPPPSGGDIETIEDSHCEI